MKQFSPGDKVRWNSEAGTVHGKVTKVHHRDFQFMGKTRRASPDAPQYEVESDRTGHKAAHHPQALDRI